MISELTVPRWILFFLSIIIFNGPGIALLQFYPFRKSLDSIGNLVYSVIFSLTVWSFLLLILRFFPFKVNREIAYIFFIVGWLLFLIKSKPWKLSQFKLFFS